MKHPANSYEDLGFLILKDWKEGDPVPPKFMVFFDSKKEAEAASRYLASRVSLALCDKMLWFHAGMTAFFRVEQVNCFSCWLQLQCASERSQWPMSSSVKSNILIKANLHTYVELCEV